MINSLLAVFLGSLFLISCNQKEMKISRSDYSVVTELYDISPAYIDKDKNGNAVLNKNSLIGNTHWVLSVNRELSLEELSVFLKELTDKKHNKDGMHPDDKDIYFIYSDTVHKQNAYVKMPFKSIGLEEPPVYELSEGVSSLLIDSVADVKKTGFDKNEEYLVQYDKNMNIETFINTLIELEKQNISGNVNEGVYVY